MTVTKVKDGGTLDAGSSATATITVPAGGHALGNCVIATLTSASDPGTTTVTDTRGNTWLVVESFYDAGNFSYVGIAVSVLTTALQAGDTIVWHPTNNVDPNAYSIELTSSVGFPATAAVVQGHTNHSNTFGTDWYPGSVTPSVGNGCAVAVFTSDNNSGTNTPVGSWVEDYDHNGAAAFRGSRVEHLFISSTSAVGGATTVGTNSASDDGPAAIVVIQETAAQPDQIVTVNADISRGNWLAEPGDGTTNLYAQIDEPTTADASDYIMSSLSPASADISKFRIAPLQAPTKPRSDNTFHFRVDHMKDQAGGDNMQLTVKLYAADGLTLLKSWTPVTVGSETTTDFTLTGAEADTIPDADFAVGLVLSFEALKI